MKVLFVHEGYIAEKNGCYYSTAYNNEIIERYKYFGSDITFLTRKQNNYKSNQTQNKLDTVGFRFVGIDNFMNIKGIMIYGDIKKIVKQEVIKADYIIVRLPGILGNLAVKYAKKYNKRYMIEVVGCPVDAFNNHSLKGKFLVPIMYLTTKYNIKNSEYVMYVSRHFLQEKYPSKGYSIGCPDVILDKSKPEILEKRIDKINKNKDIMVIGLIGSLDVDYRGHDTLIKAIVELKKRNIKCTAKFLGSGSKERWNQTLRKYSAENDVEFCGILPSGEPVLNWIDDIDILAMPTKAETLGRAIIEAMSRGCPVIGSIETAIGEQIGSDCLIAANDFIDLADHIEEMYNNKEYMIYCAQENFYRSFKYSKQQIKKNRETFYQKFISNE